MPLLEFASHLSLANIVTAIVTYFALATFYSALRGPKLPSNIPWMGSGNGWLARFRDGWVGIMRSRQWLKEGYQRYGKYGQTFLLPGSLGGQPQIIIPRNQFSWMLDQPDSVLSTRAAHYDTLHGAYMFITPNLIWDPYHERVVHKNLARNLSAIIPDMDDEVSKNVDGIFGLDTQEWKTFDILDSMMRLVPGITNRMLVGEPLCNNKHFLKNMLGFTEDVIRGFLIFSLAPRIFHSIIGVIAGLAPKYHYWQTRKWSLPLVKKRCEDLRKKDAGDPAYKNWEPPNDFVTWSYRTAASEGRIEETDPEMICMRLLPLNFASIHTTAVTGHRALIDILKADPSVLLSLREEAKHIFDEEGGKWTKEGLSRMYRMDSAIRESMRFSPISLTFMQKKVIAKEGLTSPEGIHFSYGATLSCPWRPIAEDDELHTKPDSYDAFRYSRPREEYEHMFAEQKKDVDVLKLKQSGMVTTSEKHFPFGHGRHACPGRFFVSHELKMIFGNLLINYDIKNVNDEIKEQWVGTNSIPPQVKIEVKRRKAD